MKIGMVAPLFESCPPKFYGGTERIVANLCDGLVEQGHDVSLFASGDSNCKANLIEVLPQAIRREKMLYQEVDTSYILQLGMVQKIQQQFDIIHNHIGYTAFPFINQSICPWITTNHGPLDTPELNKVYNFFGHLPMVSISNNQRQPLPDINWLATVYHGINLNSFKPKFNSGNYLAFLGRIDPTKGIETAIKVAINAEIPLKIAAKIDPDKQNYFDSVVKKHIDGQFIEFVGEINEYEKNDFLGNALALLSPICWHEPFGMVVIEAYACGTPVIGCPLGSFLEIIESGKTGYLANDLNGLVDAVKKVDQLDRQYIRQVAETHFSCEVMTQNYLNIYQLICKKS